MAQWTLEQFKHYQATAARLAEALLAWEQLLAVLPQEGMVYASDEQLEQYLTRHEQAQTVCMELLRDDGVSLLVNRLGDSALVDHLLILERPTPAMEERTYQLLLAKRWSDGDNGTDWHDDVEAHYRRFPVTHRTFANCKEFLLSLAERIDDLLANEEAQQMQHQERLKEREKHLAKLQLLEHERALIEALREHRWLKHRHEHVLRFAQSRIEPIGQELARRRGQTASMSTGPLRGMTACRGCGEGPAYIVQADTDVSAMPDGTVLVIAAARPEYTVAFRRAAAIVCDSGGVTSHAAIIAREYKIPCVVATREATTKLKNGQPVRVDADTGTVHLL